MTILALVAVAVVLLLLPSPKKPVPPMFSLVPTQQTDPAPALPKQVQYLDAVASLQSVRHRLVATDQLGEEQREAINVLTLALVGGSEK